MSEPTFAEGQREAGPELRRYVFEINSTTKLVTDFFVKGPLKWRVRGGASREWPRGERREACFIYTRKLPD